MPYLVYLAHYFEYVVGLKRCRCAVNLALYKMPLRSGGLAMCTASRGCALLPREPGSNAFVSHIHAEDPAHTIPTSIFQSYCNSNKKMQHPRWGMLLRFARALRLQFNLG